MFTDAAFVITNSKIALHPIIYCSADFCDLFSFTKAQLLLKSSNFSFLCGEKTSSESIQALADGLVCDRETKLQLSLYTRKGNSFHLPSPLTISFLDEVRQCEVTITPLTDEFGRVSLHIIFFEAVEEIHLEKRQVRCASARRISSIATMIFHRGKEPPRNSLKRIHQLSQSVRHELLPKEVVLSRRPSENIPAGKNHKMSISSLFINDLKSLPEPTNTEKSRSTSTLSPSNPDNLGARFDSISVGTANSVTLRSSVQTSRASVANESIKKSELRPKSCSNAPPLWPDHQSSETESTTDRARPASAVLGGRCSRYALPSLLARGSRLISAPASQTSIVLSDAGTLQVVLGKHGDQAKSHVTDTFAKVPSKTPIFFPTLCERLFSTVMSLGVDFVTGQGPSREAQTRVKKDAQVHHQALQSDPGCVGLVYSPSCHLHSHFHTLYDGISSQLQGALMTCGIILECDKFAFWLFNP